MLNTLNTFVTPSVISFLNIMLFLFFHQFFNFMFIPRANRVLFIGFIELMWTNCLCFMKDLEITSEESESESDLAAEID